MQIDNKGKDLPTLLALYGQEVDTLRSKLLEGDSWQTSKGTEEILLNLS